MFQAIVHAPALRPGARLCLSDLSQSATRQPSRPAAGDAVILRFGTCCPDHGGGAITDVGIGTAILRVAGTPWRLSRCPMEGGVDVPGLVAEDWFVVDRT